MKIKRFIEKSPIVPIFLSSRKIESSLLQAFPEPHFSIWEGLILSAIFFEDRSCRPSDIAKALEMSRSQMSQTLRRMEKKSLIKRELSRENARTISLTLTSQGKRSALRAIHAFDVISRDIDRKLGVSNAEQAAKTLLKI